VHVVGFIIKKFVTMHGYTNVKKKCIQLLFDRNTEHTPSPLQKPISCYCQTSKCCWLLRLHATHR